MNIPEEITKLVPKWVPIDILRDVWPIGVEHTLLLSFDLATDLESKSCALHLVDEKVVSEDAFYQECEPCLYAPDKKCPDAIIIFRGKQRSNTDITDWKTSYTTLAGGSTYEYEVEEGKVTQTTFGVINV